MGFYDFLNNLLKSFDKTKGFNFDISNPKETTEPIQENFDPNAGKGEAFYKYMQNGNFRNARKALKKFNEFWDADENYRKQNFEADQELNKLMTESLERMNKGSYFDDISERSQLLDAIDYHNAGWRIGDDGSWKASTTNELRWNNIAKKTMGGNNNMNDVINFQNEMNKKYNAGLVVDGKLGSQTLKWWQSQHGGAPVQLTSPKQPNIKTEQNPIVGLQEPFSRVPTPLEEYLAKMFGTNIQNPNNFQTANTSLLEKPINTYGLTYDKLKRRWYGTNGVSRKYIPLGKWITRGNKKILYGSDGSVTTKDIKPGLIMGFIKHMNNMPRG